MTSKIKFYKYQGAGNDFILIDNRAGIFDANASAYIQQLCDRKFGIGADGLMLLQDKKNFDFEMVYFNADGREGTMCGNGGRCIVAFARDLGLIEGQTDFLAVDGPHQALIAADQVDLEMIAVKDVQRDGEAYVLNTGSPHYVRYQSALADFDVYHEGAAIRNNSTYIAEGINVNFVEQDQQGYFVRTFERGVEDETLACGTGATAAAIAMAIENNWDGALTIPIRVLGGQLQISFRRTGNTFEQVRLKGPAQFVFAGEI